MTASSGPIHPLEAVILYQKSGQQKKALESPEKELAGDCFSMVLVLRLFMDFLRVFSGWCKLIPSFFSKLVWERQFPS